MVHVFTGIIFEIKDEKGIIKELLVSKLLLHLREMTNSAI